MSYRGLRSPEYWAKRTEEYHNHVYGDLSKREEKMLKQFYQEALEEVQGLLAAYGAKHELTYAEAMIQLREYDLQFHRRRMAQLAQQIQSGANPFAIAEMEKLTSMAAATRLDALVQEIDAQLIQLGMAQQLTMEDHLAQVYTNTYNFSSALLVEATGVAAFAKINSRAVEKAIQYHWHGEMFSERIWNNRSALVRELKKVVVDGLIKGQSVQGMSRDLNRSMNRGYKNALRLIRTETAEVLTRSTLDSYNQNEEVNQYRFLATLDERTSKVCSNLDGKVFKLSEAQTGVNLPPLHPNCRSAIAPYFPNTK